MTAIITIKHATAMHVLTDGAAWQPGGASKTGPKGEPAFECSKTVPLPHLNAVIAARGSPIFAPVLAQLLGPAQVRTFDGIAPVLAPLAVECCSMVRQELFDLVLAGISETRGPTAFFMCNHDGHGPDVRPLQVVDLPALGFLPGGPEITAEIAAMLPAGGHSGMLDPVRDGLQMLEIMRRHPQPWYGRDGETIDVGGFAQLTTVAADGISMRVIHRWGDNAPRQNGHHVVPIAAANATAGLPAVAVCENATASLPRPRA